MSPVKIMGIDPGSRATGWGVISCEQNRVSCVSFGVIRLSVASPEPLLGGRLKAIFDQLLELFAEHHPDALAVEGVFHAVNSRSALVLGHVRGVILLAAECRQLSVAEFSPLEVKKAVAGYGRADKVQVQTMVRTLLGLPENPRPHDASDALAIALCRAFRGEPGRGRTTSWRAVDVRKLKAR